MGGRVAEQQIFDEVTTGASDDLERGTKVALSMIKRYGMSETLGPRTFGKREELVFLGREISEQRDYGDRVAEEIDEEVKDIIKMAYQRSEEILITHKPKLVRMAEYLIEHESVSGDLVGRIFNDEDLGEETETPAVLPETPPYAPAPGYPTVPQPAPSLSSQGDPAPAADGGE